MGSIIGTFLAGVGLLTAAGATLALMVAAGLTGGAPESGLVLVAAAGFLVGVIVFGYGAGLRTAY